MMSIDAPGTADTAPASTLTAPEIEKLTGNLRRFLEALRALADADRHAAPGAWPTTVRDPHRRQQAVETSAETPSIDIERLRALLISLAGPLEQARRNGSLADVWDIAGLRRNEVRTAAVLSALWNPRLCGTIAVEFLAAFLAGIEADENYPTRDELAAGYSIRTEDRPLGRANERVDIVIEGPAFLLGIEIKIDALEGDQQLSAYRNALQARAALRQQRPTLVFLSRRKPLDPFARHALWRHVVAAARSVVPGADSDRTFVHRLIAQFATHVTDF